MNERLPYEEQLSQHWNDLPLPDENMAWADMKRRLDEDDDDAVAWWRRGCALWGGLLLLAILAGWWLFFRRQPAPDRTQVSSAQSAPDSYRVSSRVDSHQVNNRQAGGPGVDSSGFIIPNEQSINTDSVPDINRINKEQPKVNTLPASINTGGDLPIKGLATDAGMATKGHTYTAVKPAKKERRNNSFEITGAPVATAQQKQVSQSIASQEATIDALPVGQKDTTMGATLTHAQQQMKGIVADTMGKKDTARPKQVVKEEKPARPSIVKKDSIAAKRIFFSAGIAENQQLPVNGQKLVPYNAQGRKGSLADYIPSVYFRVNKEKKWFGQVEFRYGAPQSAKEFLYGDKSHEENIGTNHYTVTTFQRVKKTYYHQLAASFHYDIAPSLTVGAGMVWNKFMNAVSDQEVHRRNNATLLDSVIVPMITTVDKNTSVFSKSYFQALLETQYQWKRFSFGARYSFGLQPYIRFTLSAGTEQKQRNSSLQLFLRYELWRSGNR